MRSNSFHLIKPAQNTSTTLETNETPKKNSSQNETNDFTFSSASKPPTFFKKKRVDSLIASAFQDKVGNLLKKIYGQNEPSEQVSMKYEKSDERSIKESDKSTKIETEMSMIDIDKVQAFSYDCKRPKRNSSKQSEKIPNEIQEQILSTCCFNYLDRKSRSNEKSSRQMNKSISSLSDHKEKQVNQTVQIKVKPTESPDLKENNGIYQQRKQERKSAERWGVLGSGVKRIKLKKGTISSLCIRVEETKLKDTTQGDNQKNENNNLLAESAAIQNKIVRSSSEKKVQLKEALISEEKGKEEMINKFGNQSIHQRGGEEYVQSDKKCQSTSKEYYQLNSHGHQKESCNNSKQKIKLVLSNKERFQNQSFQYNEREFAAVSVFAVNEKDVGNVQKHSLHKESKLTEISQLKKKNTQLEQKVKELQTQIEEVDEFKLVIDKFKNEGESYNYNEKRALMLKAQVQKQAKQIKYLTSFLKSAQFNIQETKTLLSAFFKGSDSYKFEVLKAEQIEKENKKISITEISSQGRGIKIPKVQQQLQYQKEENLSLIGKRSDESRERKENVSYLSNEETPDFEITSENGGEISSILKVGEINNNKQNDSFLCHNCQQQIQKSANIKQEEHPIKDMLQNPNISQEVAEAYQKFEPYTQGKLHEVFKQLSKTETKFRKIHLLNMCNSNPIINNQNSFPLASNNSKALLTIFNNPSCSQIPQLNEISAFRIESNLSQILDKLVCVMSSLQEREEYSEQGFELIKCIRRGCEDLICLGLIGETNQGDVAQRVQSKLNCKQASSDEIGQQDFQCQLQFYRKKEDLFELYKKQEILLSKQNIECTHISNIEEQFDSLANIFQAKENLIKLREAEISFLRKRQELISQETQQVNQFVKEFEENLSRKMMPIIKKIQSSLQSVNVAVTLQNYKLINFDQFSKELQKLLKESAQMLQAFCNSYAFNSNYSDIQSLEIQFQNRLSSVLQKYKPISASTFSKLSK